MRFLQSVFILCFLCASLISFAFDARPGSIKGTVKLSDGKPAAYVSIAVKGTTKGAITEENGTFVIRNVNAGRYDLEVSLAGYDKITQSVTVTDDAAADANFTLNLSADQLREVVVITGRSGYRSNMPSSTLRLNEPLSEAPQNIQIVTEKALHDQQIISMSDGAVRNVSGAVRLEHWGDLYTNISMRGSQIQAFRNGFNVVNSYWGPLTEDMSFVDHIEFVKGPASFMIANGDPSGLYNVVTKKPTGVTKGEVEMTTGSFGLYRGTIDLDGKLNRDGKLLYRLNVMGQEKGSFRANEFNNRYSIAPVVSYQVDDKTKVTLEYTLQHARMSDVGSYYVFSSKGFAMLPRNYTFLPAGIEPTTIDDQSIFLNLQHQIDDNWKLTAQAAYFNYMQIGTSTWPNSVSAQDSVIRSIGSWDAKSNMTLAQAFINGDVYTGAIHHRILGGIDIGTKNYFADWGQSFALDTVAISLNSPISGTSPAGYPSFDHNKKTLEQRAQKGGGLMDLSYTSLYIQDEFGFLNNTVRFTLAGRYTTAKQSAWGGEAASAEHFTPRAGLSVSIDKNTTAYAVYDQAFLPQNGRLASGKIIQPLTGNNMELGVKKDWANGNWNTTLSVYRILKNNEQTASPNSTPNNPIYIELGQKRAQGIEFDLRGKIVSGLNLIANYAYTDSRVTRVNKDAAAGANIKEGDQVPGYAKQTANAWLTYKIQNGSLKGVGISAGASFAGGRETYWDVSPDPTQKLPDYVKFDGGLFWEGAKLRVTANVFNIANKFIYDGSYYQWLKAYYWQANAPRNLRFSIAYKF